MNPAQNSSLKNSPFVTLQSRAADQLVDAVISGFYDNYQRPDIRRSHLFNGRYENIYLDTRHIPALQPLIDEALDYARVITGIDQLRTGYWFNHMPHGAVTTKHSHDNDDELLSAVLYLKVPQNSGDLHIHHHHGNIRITPQTGQYVFFKADVVHEVTVNNSGDTRLSLAFNFGLAHPDE